MAKMQRHRQNTNVAMPCHPTWLITLALTRHRLPRNEDQRRGAGGIGSFLNKLSVSYPFESAFRDQSRWRSYSYSLKGTMKCNVLLYTFPILVDWSNYFRL